MTSDAGADAAHQLLLAHADRALTGPLEDPALLAAVVGIERLVVATGSTDAPTLRAALAGEPVAGTDADELARLVPRASAMWPQACCDVPLDRLRTPASSTRTRAAT